MTALPRLSFFLNLPPNKKVLQVGVLSKQKLIVPEEKQQGLWFPAKLVSRIIQN